jgi:nicotinate-nucleotide pyrophosphorylase (carboxylating)
MSTFTPAEADACRRLVELALAEDLGHAGDRTSLATIPADKTGRAAFVARSEGVLAGLPAVVLVAKQVDPALGVELVAADGDRLTPRARVAVIGGPLRSLLAAERTALNFLQRLCGVATLTRRYVDAVAGLPVQVLDTRKTTPGWRLLEKYAVRMGGGHNHRMGLCDGVLIKDNHLAAIGPGPDSVAIAVLSARTHYGQGVPIEVEVDTLEQLDVALGTQPDIVLLDNMTTDQMREAIRRRDERAPGVLLEASGGVSLATIADIAATGIDRISVGALTHSAVALDIGLDYLT